MQLKNIIECLLFVSSKPLTVSKIADIMDGQKPVESPLLVEIEKAISELTKEYEDADKPIFIQQVAGGWRIATKSQYGEWVRKLFAKEMTYTLSRAALETLAIVAYRQPTTIQEVDLIRGVSSQGVLRGLLEKNLIKIAGRKEELGRPIIYRTTDKFLTYFGLESISDIPPLEEMGIEKDVEEIIDDRRDKFNKKED